MEGSMTNNGGCIVSVKKLISSRTSSSVPDGYQSISVFASLKQLTAGFVGDLEPQQDYPASTSRNLGRIGVTFVTLMIFAAMAVFLLMNAVPSSRTVRDWAPYTDSQGQRIFNFTSNDSEKFRNDTSNICFCRKTNINWPTYVAFFPLTMATGGGTNSNLIRGQNISSSDAFCKRTILNPESPQNGSSSLSWNACLAMVEAVVAPNISQTCLESASLIGPSLLNDTIASRVTGGLDQAFWNYKVLTSLTVTQDEYKLISRLHSLWIAMLDQFNKNHESSNHDYWIAAKNSADNVLTVIKGDQTALGMEVIWHYYANQCNPPFCDLVKQNSWLYRTFLVIAQVGGISTLVILFVRVFLWPAFRHLFGWPLLRRSDVAQKSQLKHYSSFSGKVNPVDQTTLTSAEKVVDTLRVTIN